MYFRTMECLKYLDKINLKSIMINIGITTEEIEEIDKEEPKEKKKERKRESEKQNAGEI